MTEVKRITITLDCVAIQDLIRELDGAIPEWEITYWPPVGYEDATPSIRLEHIKEKESNT